MSAITYIFGGIVILLGWLFVLELCKSAGDADREMERLFKEETEIIHR